MTARVVSVARDVAPSIMPKIKAVVLDFDNCIILDEKTRQGSEEVKDDAWFRVFSEYSRVALGPVLEQAKREIVGGKGDRKDIVRRICRHFGYSEAKIEEEVERRCDLFNQVVQDGIKQIGVSEKTRQAIVEFSAKLPLFVNTATPIEAAMESLDFLGIVSYFKAIYGRPGTKIENLRNIIAAESILPSELLFVDDQQSGWLAAQEVGCVFVGMHTARNRLWHDNVQPFRIIYFLTELLNSIC